MNRGFVEDEVGEVFEAGVGGGVVLAAGVFQLFSQRLQQRAVALQVVKEILCSTNNISSETNGYLAHLQ